MTGPYETELATIANASDWWITGITDLKSALADLQSSMDTLATSPGWTGVSADSASAMFDQLKTDFVNAENAVAAIYHAIALANTAKADATLKYHKLPDASVPTNIQNAITKGLPFTPPVFVPSAIAADAVAGFIANYLGNQREDQAKAIVQTLHADLQEPTTSLAAQNTQLAAGGKNRGMGDETQIIPTGGTGDVDGQGYRRSFVGSGGVGGSISDPGTGQGRLITDPQTDPNVQPFPSDPSVDGSLAGGTVPGSGSGSGSGSGGSGVGSGQGVGGIGAGIGGSAAAAAGLAVASRLGGGLGAAGGLGGASSLGGGGLLGSGKVGGGAAAEEGAGGAGGAKSGTSMMGQGGGGAGRNKEKRSGLGGIIAPKLDDEEEVGPRSSRAMAGGRDTAKGE
jgi:uncharacterized protein YukE